MIDEEEDNLPFDVIKAVEINRQRLKQRFALAADSGQQWLVECRDLGDAYDNAAGVYFVECANEAALNQIVAKCTDDNPYDRLLGIFDLGKPLEEQGSGMSRNEWLSKQL